MVSAGDFQKTLFHCLKKRGYRRSGIRRESRIGDLSGLATYQELRETLSDGE